jgi:hypothetical protein
VDTKQRRAAAQQHEPPPAPVQRAQALVNRGVEQLVHAAFRYWIAQAVVQLLRGNLASPSAVSGARDTSSLRCWSLRRKPDLAIWSCCQARHPTTSVKVWLAAVEASASTMKETLAEGTELLSKAKAALSSNSESGLTMTIINAHGAAEHLFRYYLSSQSHVPESTRSSADVPFRTNFPDLVRGMASYGRPPLKDEADALLELNRIRNSLAHPMSDGKPQGSQLAEPARRFLTLVEEIYAKYSARVEGAENGLLPSWKAISPANGSFVRFERANKFSYFSSKECRLIWCRGHLPVLLSVQGRVFKPWFRGLDTAAWVSCSPKTWVFDIRDGLMTSDGIEVGTVVSVELEPECEDDTLKLLVLQCSEAESRILQLIQAGLKYYFSAKPCDTLLLSSEPVALEMSEFLCKKAKARKIPYRILDFAIISVQPVREEIRLARLTGC